MKKAEITAFLSLIFILLVSFIGSVIDVTSLQIAKNYRRMDAEMAIECLFAEYQKELLDEYDIFALDSGYESGNYSNDLISKRMEYYGLVNAENSIERIKFLSDGSGDAFCQQVIKYMEHKYGIDYVKDYLKQTDVWQKQEGKVLEYQKEEGQNKEVLDDIFSQVQEDFEESDNPITHVDGLKKSAILKLVMPKDKVVSEKTLSFEEAPSHRRLNVGYKSLQDEREFGITEKLLFGEYILEHFSSAVDQSENVLDYEIEYLIAGQESERENLEAVVKKLAAFRFVPNYTYLQSSADKIAQAEALALTMGAVIAIPGAYAALAQGILLAWAYAESLVDIKTLLKGNKVPLVKDGSGWQLSLSELMKLGEDETVSDGQNAKDGMDYKDYLKILLFLEKKEELSMRCLDLMELNLKKIHGLSFFKVDLCVTEIHMKCRCSFRRGITYTFPVDFSYQ